ncbi:MAG: SAVED domain-containing protein [Cyanobacteriota bacterium]
MPGPIRFGSRPVVFIAHSLGGLLVKSVLRLAAESPDAPERRRVVEQTRDVMFVATPHQGSSLATLATAIKVYLPSVSVRDLRANDAHLNALFLWYRSYAPRHTILTRSYVENQATNGVVVVTASSADPGVTGPTARDPVPLDRNHVEICRPRDRGDQLVLVSVELIRQILEGDSTPPAQSAPEAGGDGAVVVVRSFAPQGNVDSDAALLIDLTDLFDDRLPIDNEVWSRAIPERIAAALPAIAELPQPVVLAPQAHLSIAWFLGTLLNPKRGIRVNVRQRGMGGKSIWDVCQAQDPAGGGGWQWSVEALNHGPELSLVVSATHDALADARRSIDALALPIGRLVHGTLPVPGYEAVVDGGHARWLADGLVRHVQELVVADPPRRLHLFAACPATLMVLLGQRASVLGPTTAYEFLLEDGSRRYLPGMATPGAGA